MSSHRFSRLRRRGARPLAIVVLSGTVLSLGGCSDGQAGALLGLGIGAVAGQAIGGDTEATLIGAGVGAGAGYIVGNESDKRRDRYRYDRRHYDY